MSGSKGQRTEGSGDPEEHEDPSQREDSESEDDKFQYGTQDSVYSSQDEGKGKKRRVESESESESESENENENATQDSMYLSQREELSSEDEDEQERRPKRRPGSGSRRNDEIDEEENEESRRLQAVRDERKRFSKEASQWAPVPQDAAAAKADQGIEFSFAKATRHRTHLRKIQEWNSQDRNWGSAIHPFISIMRIPRSGLFFTCNMCNEYSLDRPRKMTRFKTIIDHICITCPQTKVLPQERKHVRERLQKVYEQYEKIRLRKRHKRELQIAMSGSSKLHAHQLTVQRRKQDAAAVEALAKSFFIKTGLECNEANVLALRTYVREIIDLTKDADLDVTDIETLNGETMGKALKRLIRKVNSIVTEKIQTSAKTLYS